MNIDTNELDKIYTRLKKVHDITEEEEATFTVKEHVMPTSPSQSFESGSRIPKVFPDSKTLFTNVIK